MRRINISNIKATKQSGITLIALVITIIVLLILAGVTVATLTGDNGLLSKVGEAKNANEEVTAIEKIQVEVIGSYNKNGKIDIENQLNQNLQKISGLKYNGKFLDNTNKISKLPSEVELDGHSYVIQEDGNVEKLIWVQDKTAVTNTQTGKTYEVGDIVDYDCGVAEYTGQWGILGAENGSLLLMSTINVTNVTLNGKNDYLTDGTIKLDNACASYKNELYATKARSINVEDINRVTGYKEPEAKEYTYTMVGGYVKRNDRDNPSNQTKFTYIDGRKLQDDSFISVLSNSYTYKINSYIPTNSKANILLNDNEIYWLNSKVVDVYDSNVRWGFRRVYADGVTNNGNNELFDTYNDYEVAQTYKLRTVVILKPNIQLRENVYSEGVYEIY